MFTRQWVTCVFANGSKARYPTADIEIVSRDFKGKTRALVIKDLVKDLIVFLSPTLYER